MRSTLPEVEVPACLLCGQPGNDCVYVPKPGLIRYALCERCGNGPDRSLEIESKLDVQRYLDADREAGETLAIARRINTERLTEVRELHGRIGRMLRASGEAAKCRDCGGPITWLWNRGSGRASPYDSDGQSHFKTCPNRAEVAVEVLLREAT